MSKTIKGLGLATIVILGMSATVIQNDKLFEITKNIEIFATAFQKINTNYVDEIDPSELMRIGLDAMVGSLDPYTNYISETQIESYRLANEGKYQGVGAIIDKVDDYVTVIETFEDGPAVKAGLLAGDQIIKVNGFDTKGKSTDEVNAIAKGVAGTTLNLRIKRQGESAPFDVELIRGEVSRQNVPYSGRVADKIGYISLTVFTENAGKNIQSAYKELTKEESLDGLILDLRSNGGGLLREAIGICNLFLPAGKEVVTTKGKVKDRDRSYKTMSPPTDLDIPIVVLTNKSSASASEIVSGSLQDYDRAVVMGQRTFGKGLVQNTEEIGYNSRVKITTSKYYIPSRRCIQAVKYENGEPVDIPDSERSKFKTENGRTVLDGGGVTPDVKLEPNIQSEFTKSLVKNKIIFKYVNEFVQGKDSADIAEPREFKFQDYEGFKAFVAQSGFEFESNIEKELKKLKEESEAGLSTDFSALEAKIEMDQQDDLDQYKGEIIKEIELNVISRFYFQSGKAKHKLNGDSEIQEAIKLLNDMPRYKSILGK